MLKNIIKLSFRDAMKSPLLSAINVGGLALGFSAFLVIVLFVSFDLGHDEFVPDHDRIHRVEITYVLDNGTEIHASAGPVSAKPVFLAEFPEQFEAATRFYVRENVEIRSGDDVFIDNVMVADADFFNVFDLPFVSGGRESAFKSTNSMVLTESMARKYFGDQDPIGRVLDSYVVTAVIRDLPQNSHLSLGIMVHVDFSTLSWWETYSERWDMNFMYTYLKIRDASFAHSIRNRFDYLIPKYLGPMLDGTGVDPNEYGRLRMVGLTDIHFEETSLGAIKPHSSKAGNYAFLGVAVLILAIAILNFVNLSTARATRRAKEIAVRKVLGAKRWQLITHFMGEAILLTLAAATLGIVFLEMLAPWLQSKLGVPLQIIAAVNLKVLIQFFFFIVVVGIVAGVYPAILLSGFRPASHLSSGRTEVTTTIRTRSLLVAFQFASAIALIICTVVIYQQTSFARSVDLGFDKEGVLVLNRLTRDKVSGSVDALISELRRHPDTIAASPSQHVPGEDSEGNIGVRLPGDDVGIRRTLTWQDVGHDFYSVLSVEAVAGRVFSRDFPADALTVRDETTQIEYGSAVINVSAVKSLGFSDPDEVLGKRLIVGDGGTEVNVIGVVPDLRYRSVRQPVRPSIYMLDLDPLDALLIKYSSENATAYFEDLKLLWQRVVPDAVIQWEHLDKKLDALYGSEDRWADMFFASSLMAVFISVLGLFGLTTFAVERRSLEVGIRKILGAKARQIVGLFSWQFTRPLMLASLVAWPLAWYFMSEWLANFAIRIKLNVWPFVLATALVFVVAWITVASCSYRIARSRPAQSMRYQ